MSYSKNNRVGQTVGLRQASSLWCVVNDINCSPKKRQFVVWEEGKLGGVSQVRRSKDDE